MIVLSTWAELAYALKLFESGFDSRGYLLKDRIRDRGQIIDAVRMVASGGTVIDPRIIEDPVRSRTDSTEMQLDELTPRELQAQPPVTSARQAAIPAAGR